MSDSDLRGTLRGLRVFDVDLPGFDPKTAPPNPDRLFAEWLSHAIEMGVREPHAMTLSTVDVEGRPNSRVLLLKRLTEGRWGFATSRKSRKGVELDARPWAALSFYWPQVGRAVRVRGRIIDSGREEASLDFLARSEASRAASWVGKQSQVLDAPDDLENALAAARAKVAANPGAVPEEWTRYDLLADEVEFWQADREGRHRRLRYTLATGLWHHEQLWP